MHRSDTVTQLRSRHWRAVGPGALAAAWLLVLPGCADDHESPADYQTLPVIAGCEDQSYAVCDPLEAACQARVFATVQCLRHMPEAVLPPIRVISSAEQLQEFRTEFAVEEPQQVASTLAEERALRLLGLARAGELSSETMAQLLADTAPAYYTPSTGQVTLIADDGNEPRDLAQDTLTLSHEFVHALQDQDVGLATVYQGTTSFDDYLARISLIEGEASMLEGFVDAALWGFGENPDFRTHFTSWVARAEEEFEDLSPLLVASRYVPYSYGTRYVYNLYEQGGIELVRSRFGDPPRSLLPILHSVDHVDEPALESFTELSVPGALEGFELVTGDTLGPWVFGKFLERLLPVSAVPVDVVDAWRADRLLVYATAGTAQTLTALWTLRFADTAAAERLIRSLQSGQQSFPLSASAFYSRRERDVTIGVSEDAPSLPQWSASLELAQQSWGQSSGAAARPRLPRPGLAALRERLLSR